LLIRREGTERGGMKKAERRALAFAIRVLPEALERRLLEAGKIHTGPRDVAKDRGGPSPDVEKIRHLYRKGLRELLIKVSYKAESGRFGKGPITPSFEGRRIK